MGTNFATFYTLLFLRLSRDTPPQIVFTLMTAHWGVPSPNLVVSVVGGEGQEKVKPWVREVMRNGLVRAAQSTGEAGRAQKKVVAVGVAPWGLVHNRQQLVNAQGSFPARYYVQNTSQDTCGLDSNYQAFLLVDDGTVGLRGGETSFLSNLEDYISHQRTGIWGSGSIEIPVLCMLISGEAKMLQRVDQSLRKAIPWLVLGGSGPAADLITEILEEVSLGSSPSSPLPEGGEGPSTELRDRVREKVRRHFPAEANLEKLVDWTFFVGSTTVIQRMKTYIQDIWNKCDLTAITVFALAVACRMFDESYHFGRALMALDFMVFTLRLIHIFAIHKQLGPKIIIVSKMMKDVFFFLFFLFVWVMAYGVANQALLYSYDPRPSWIFRRVFYRPYLHIFGQIPINEMDADKLLEVECTDNRTLIEAGEEPCMDGSYNWLVVLLLVVYLLVTNILLINLLIAMFSYTFSKVQDHSDTHWKFQRYNLIVEYHSRPCLAPPFIILSHLHLFIKRFVRRIPSAKVKHFVLELRGRAAGRLNTWEGLQKENLLSAQNKRLRDSDTARLKRTSVKVDTVLKQMSEIRDRDRRLRLLESEVEFCSSALSWLMEALSESNVIKPTRPPPLPSRDMMPLSPSVR
ncbi:unnamed protein product [Arctogadus glacialis]